MSNIFTPSLTNAPKVGSPAVVQGTLEILVSSIVHQSFVSTPAVAHINLGGHSIVNTQHKFGVPSLYATSQYNEANTQVEFQVPGFIQDEHREFLSFMREYYRFNEKNGGPLEFLRRLLLVQDIDTTTNELVEYFYREFAPSFPRSSTLTPAVIIKNIKSFYLAKGSEKSFKFLFRVFFGQDVDFYYPRIDIMRFSDAKWVQDITAKCVLISGDPSNLIGNRVIGASSKASAYVEKVLLVQDGSITSVEMFLNRSSIVGKFQADEILKDEQDTCRFRVLPLIVKIKVTNKGQGYQTGQKVLVRGDGYNCNARISAVDSSGGVETVKIYQFGAGYKPATTKVEFVDAEGVTEKAEAVPVFDTTAKYPGYFLNSDGQFSSGKRIQDGYYYQQYSYVIKSEESRDKYESIVKRLVHPAGFTFFSEVTTESLIDASTSLPATEDDTGSVNAEILNEVIIPQEDGAEQLTDAPEYDPPVERVTEDPEFNLDYLSLGPTWEDWDKWKMDYRPTPSFGQPNDEMFDPSYYDQYANTPLKVFADVKLSEFSLSRSSPIDHLPETSISQELYQEPPPVDEESMILEYDLSALAQGDSFEVRLPLTVSSGSVDVEWGDGSTGTYDVEHGERPIKTYTAPGVYQVKVRGQVTTFSFHFVEGSSALRRCISFGTIPLTSLAGAFARCANLVSVPNRIPSTVTSISWMFYNATSFNGPLNSWDVSNLTDMSNAFRSATSFNQPLNNWDVSSVTNMTNMFCQSGFNSPIGNWNVSNVTDMGGMFASSPFNQPLNNWDVSSVTNMVEMFGGAYSFNQPLNNWDVSSVTNMGSMFSSGVFNQPLNNWDVSSVTHMAYMFCYAVNFNQDLSNWDVSNVTNMQRMFLAARSFDSSLGDWTLCSEGVYLGDLFDFSGISLDEYSKTLIGWANSVSQNSVPTNVTLGAYEKYYSTTDFGGTPFSDAKAARDFLTSEPIAWVIQGDIFAG